MVSGEDVALLPSLSVTVAVRLYVPSASGVHTQDQGASLQRFMEFPLQKNSTDVTLRSPLITDAESVTSVPVRTSSPSLRLVAESWIDVAIVPELSCVWEFGATVKVYPSEKCTVRGASL